MSTRPALIMIVQLVASLLLAAVTGLAGYRIFETALKTAQTENLHAYIQVRAEREQRIFEDARRLNRAAGEEFLHRMDALQGQSVDDEFDRLFPSFGDGTRRSVPELFDGTALPGGDFVFGVGAYLGDGDAMTEEQKRRYLAAFHTVRSVGEAYLGTFTNLYYFTADSRMVMFAPGREDRLAFYRFEAPADFDLSTDGDDDLFDLQANPAGDMHCTRLSRLLYVNSGERAITGCRQPVIAGRSSSGAFGSSIEMTEALASAVDLPPAHGVNMLFDREGAVIARGPVAAGEESRRQYAVDPATIIDILNQDPRSFGVFATPEGSGIIAFSRIPGPNWVFVSLVDLDSMRKTARFWAWSLFAVVLLSSLIFAAVRALVLRSYPPRKEAGSGEEVAALTEPA